MTDFETIKKGEETLYTLTEPITDKNYALMMLCRTNKAWAYLSPELKADPDVMMCYQPTGYMTEEVGMYVGVFDSLGEDIYLEPEFVYWAPKNGVGRYFIPKWAKYIKDFDYKRYCNTQYAMLPRVSLPGVTYYENPGIWADANSQEKFREIESCFSSLASEYPHKDNDIAYGDRCVKIFEREALRKEFGVEDPEFEAMQR